MSASYFCALILIISAVFVPGYESTTCYVQNSIPNVFTQQCPPNIYQCMKFTCRVNNPKKFEQVTKGCNDPANPPISCTSIMTNCQAQGGIGQCYTCTGDYCNSSGFLSSLISIFIPLLIYFFC